jgi:hypothetical protein
MDFNLPIKLKINSTDYIDLNSLAGVRGGASPLSGYKVESVNYSTVAANGFMDNQALRDGATVTESYLGARGIDIVVSVYGETIGDFWDKLDQLSAALQPMPKDFTDNYGLRPLRFFQPTWAGAYSFPDGIELELTCKPSSLPTYNVSRRNSIGNPSSGFAQPVSVRLIAPNPRKTYVSSNTLTVDGASVTHRGTATVYATLSKSGCTAGDTVTWSWGDSTVVAVAIDDGAVSVETETMTQTNCRITHGSSTGSFIVYPGSVTLTGTTDATLTFREAWL